MRLTELRLSRVGPFDEADLKFLHEPDDPRRVALITGENGTGKTVIIDAIRAAFGTPYASLERDLSRPGEDLFIRAWISGTDVKDVFVNRRAKSSWGWSNQPGPFGLDVRHPWPWVVDYWRSDLATDSYRIAGLLNREPEAVLLGSLGGIYRNADVTQELCYPGRLCAGPGHHPQAPARPDGSRPEAGARPAGAVEAAP